MASVSVLELVQAFAWGVFAITPLLIAQHGAAQTASGSDMPESGPLALLIGLALQVAYGVFAFKAGGK